MSKRVTKLFSKRWVARKNGFKSGLEETVSKQITSKGYEANYEGDVIPYVIPESNHNYHPDFKLPSGIYVETKGRLVASDRKKHVLIKKQHPELDIRFLFSNSHNKIAKKSKTTYADWCTKNGFIYADKVIPNSWY
jgi:hypothetical protein